jgi:hypothetical protein
MRGGGGRLRQYAFVATSLVQPQAPPSGAPRHLPRAYSAAGRMGRATAWIGNLNNAASSSSPPAHSCGGGGAERRRGVYQVALSLVLQMSSAAGTPLRLAIARHLPRAYSAVGRMGNVSGAGRTDGV